MTKPLQVRRFQSDQEKTLAEGVGFEPTIRLPVYTLSKRAPSATRPSLRGSAQYSDTARPHNPRGTMCITHCKLATFAVNFSVGAARRRCDCLPRDASATVTRARRSSTSLRGGKHDRTRKGRRLARSHCPDRPRQALRAVRRALGQCSLRPAAAL